MNLAALPPLARRALALAILGCLGLFVWSAAIWPVMRLVSDRRAEIAALAEQHDGLNAILSRKPAIERQALEVAKNFSTRGGIWTGTSATAIAAHIQDRVREAVTGNRGHVISASTASEAAEQRLRKLTMRFTIEGTLDTVERTFAAIETAKPALFVDAFTIVAPTIGNQRDGPPPLSLELDLAGYIEVPP